MFSWRAGTLAGHAKLFVADREAAGNSIQPPPHVAKGGFFQMTSPTYNTLVVTGTWQRSPRIGGLRVNLEYAASPGTGSPAEKNRTAARFPRSVDFGISYTPFSDNSYA